MGRKLDILLRRNFRASKFKALLSLAVARLAVMKNQRQVRCTQGRGDVGQLLRIDQHDRALLRAEHVIKDQNMLDVYIMVEGFCHVLTERVNLIENQKDCPEELREAASSLIFAASRCGDFPELHEIRHVFTQRYGKEFAAAAVELRNNCGVNTKMIQKMSTKLPNYESRLKVVREIGAEIGVSVNIEKPPVGISHKNSRPEPVESAAGADGKTSPVTADSKTSLEPVNLGDLGTEEELTGSFKVRKYRDVASAAQAAFESAAYAAAAARAAVELSRTESQNRGSDDHGDPGPGQGDGDHHNAERPGYSRQRSGGIEEKHSQPEIERIYPAPVQNLSSDSEDEIQTEVYEAKLERSLSSSSLEDNEAAAGEKMMPPKGPVFDESEEELEKKEAIISRRSRLAKEANNYSATTTIKEPKSRGKVSNKSEQNREFDAYSDDETSDETSGSKPSRQREDKVESPSKVFGTFQNEFDRVALKSRNEDEVNHAKALYEGTYKLRIGHLGSEEKPGTQHPGAGKKPASVRTRRHF